MRVAAVLPLPDGALDGDPLAWSAFSGLLDDAAALLVEALGSGAVAVLRELAASPLTAGETPAALLVDRALDQLARDVR